MYNIIDSAVAVTPATAAIKSKVNVRYSIS
jgi:hypothetical protein